LALVLTIVLLLVGGIAVAILVFNQSAFNPKINCSAAVSSSEVVAYFFPDSGYKPSFVPMPQSANLSVRVTNNVSKTLYDIVVEVRYKTSDGSWNTSTIVTIDHLVVGQSKEVSFTLSNPAIRTENVKQLVAYDFNTHNFDPHFVNVTRYTLSIKDHETGAYGFAKPLNP
jgi:hypothetical protein